MTAFLKLVNKHKTTVISTGGSGADGMEKSKKMVVPEISPRASLGRNDINKVYRLVEMTLTRDVV